MNNGRVFTGWPRTARLLVSFPISMNQWLASAMGTFPIRGAGQKSAKRREWRKDRLQGLTGAMVALGAALFNLVEQLSGGQDTRRSLQPKSRLRCWQRESPTHGIAAEAAHQDVGATLLLQVFGGADGQGVAGTDHSLGGGSEQLGREPIAALQTEIPEALCRACAPVPDSSRGKPDADAAPW